jgi:TolB-like protein/Tfp pilus assembly protein PilF
MDQNCPQPARSFSSEAIRCELQRILASRTFRAAQGQRKFLAYAVEEVLAGHANLLKEYVIATEALDRDASFDPRLDPIVRTEARKLRARLDKYYLTEGARDPLRVELRKGSYVPSFHEAVDPDPEPPPTIEAKEPETPSSVPETHVERPSRPGKGMLAAFAVLILAVAGAGVFYLSRASLQQTTFAANDASIGVLPLVNLSGNNQEFLNDGLTDELINSLRQVPGLQVLARISASGKKPHVRAVLEGTVRKSENRLTVAIELNNAENGYHLWSGSYERDFADIGSVLPEIASAVTNALGVGLIRSVPGNLTQTAASRNSEAQENYLKGLYFRNRYNVDSLNKAIEYFKRSIAADPSFAQSYAGLADCYAMARPVLATPPLEVVSKIQAAASKAIELDGTLGEPHIDLAVSAEYQFDWDTAGREFKRGLELSPGNAVGHLWYAWYLALRGRRNEVLTERTLAAKLDPVSPYAVESLGDYYSAVGRYDAAVQQFQSALALEPNFGLAHQDLGDSYLLQGRCGNAIEELRLANESMPGPRRMADLGYGYAVCGHQNEARRILQAFLTEPKPGVIPALAIAEIYVGLGDKDRAFPWLEKAIDERDLGLGLRWDGYYESLRSDPRFNGLLHRMRLD